MSDPVERLRAADREYREVTEEIEDVGADRVEAVADAYEEATTLLARYRGKATGTGGEEFREFVRFQDELGTFVEGLDDDLLHRSAFEAMEDRLDKRRVNDGDFERAREALSPAADVAQLRDDRRTARERYREARRAVDARIDEIDDEIDRLERLVELGEADLDAPVENLREPVEAYDEAVRDAFREFEREASARELLELVEKTANFPLVEFRQPPEELASYVREYEAGTEPVSTLLEYSEYSRSKLDHYVEDAGELKRRVTTQQTYLRRIDAEPLTVGWPPPPAEELEFLAGELVAVCSRFAPESVVARAREVRRLPHRLDYDRLREAAVARDRLDDRQRRRLADGQVQADLAELRDRRATLRDALEEYPER